MALTVTDSNIESTLTDNNVVVLDFWAPWCGPCRMVGPVIDRLAEGNNDVAIGKVNVDENPVAANQYGIRSIPTVLFFKGGELVDKLAGAQSQAAYQAKIDSLKA